MSELVIKKKRHDWLRIPHYLLVNGYMVGIMRDDEIHVQLPQGIYQVTIRSMYKFIQSSIQVTIPAGQRVTLMYYDKERLWNILFNIDLVLWVLKRFLHFPDPWDLIYEIISNGFFVVWMLRLWIIRKRYFKIITVV